MKCCLLVVILSVVGVLINSKGSCSAEINGIGLTEVSESSTFPINLRMFMRNALELNVKATDTVKMVKGMIYDSLGISIQNQILIFGFRVLQDDWTLEDYKIESESNIFLRCYDTSVDCGI